MPRIARAQGWRPSGPVRVVVPFAAGGNADITARLIATDLSPLLGVPMVVENRHSGGGIVAMRTVAAAPPDGQTILVGALSTHALNVALYTDYPVNPLTDFAHVTITCINGGSLVAVNRNFPARNLPEMREVLRASPGRYNWSSPGVGTTAQVAGAMLVHLLGVEAQHVPFRGSAASVTELLAGRVDFTVDSIDLMAAAVNAGDLKAIMVTGDRRSAALPNVPTAEEAGLAALQIATWTPWSLPKGSSPAIVDAFYEKFQAVIEDPGIVARLAERGNFATPGLTPARTREFIAAEIAKWTPLVRASGARVE
jgi:tripartite-type tricarboxylate transporter receptor subunit TctC